MKKSQKTQRENTFNNERLRNPGVDIAVSRQRSNKKLQKIRQNSLSGKANNDKQERLPIDTVANDSANFNVQASRGFVSVPLDKKALLPARYFEDLFLHRATEKGMSIQEIIKNLDLTEKEFYGFLDGKICIDITLAKKLQTVTGMPFGFWLRAQRKHNV